MFFGSDDEDLHQEDPLEYDAGFGNIIVVDNLLMVLGRNMISLKELFAKFTVKLVVIKEGGLLMPVDPDTQKTLGFCFIEYSTA